MCGIGAAGDDHRLLTRRDGVRRLDPAVLEQTVDHVVAALDRTVAIADRVQRRRSLRQRGQI